jgi:predicted secreted protein
MAVVRGKDVAFYIYDSGVWKLYACGRSCTITLSTSVIETSVTGTGTFATFIGQKHSWTASIEGVVNLDEGSQLTLSDLRALQIALTELYIRYERVDADGNGYTDEGYAIITSSSDSGEENNVATFSIELQGTGALTIHT